MKTPSTTQTQAPPKAQPIGGNAGKKDPSPAPQEKASPKKPQSEEKGASIQRPPADS